MSALASSFSPIPQGPLEDESHCTVGFPSCFSGAEAWHYHASQSLALHCWRLGCRGGVGQAALVSERQQSGGDSYELEAVHTKLGAARDTKASVTASEAVPLCLIRKLISVCKEKGTVNRWEEAGRLQRTLERERECLLLPTRLPCWSVCM